MTKTQLIEALLNDYHLSEKEVKQAKELVALLNRLVGRRK